LSEQFGGEQHPLVNDSGMRIGIGIVTMTGSTLEIAMPKASDQPRFGN